MEERLLMKSEEAARFIGIGINQLRALVKQGKVPVIKLHSRILRFYRPALEKWAENQSKLAV